MKKIISVFLSLLCIIGFATRVNAASNSISVYSNNSYTYEYVKGLPIYWNKSGGYNIYVLNSNAYYPTTTYLSNPTEVDNGFAYIINNSNVTGSTEKNYYIAQVAILWYEDYLNGNNVNISATLKDNITKNSNDTICYYINKLVNNAKKYSKNGNLININEDEITFYKSGNYFYSNEIEVEVNGLNSKPSVNFYNAPSNTTVVNNNLTNNGTGTFQIQIPINSVNKNYNDDFVINVTGNGYNYTYYKYTNGTTSAIYGYTYSNYSSKIEDSVVAKLSQFADTNVRIFVLDDRGEYISGIKYNIYNGNCSTSTCNNNTLVDTFTTRNTFTELYNLSEGTYTLVRTNGNKYDLPEKQVIYVDDSDNLQDFTISEGFNNNYNDYDELDKYTYKLTINCGLNDSTNIIKIYDDNYELIESFRADIIKFYFNIAPGSYTLIDTKYYLELFFEIDEQGNLYVSENGKKVKKDDIDLKDYILSYEESDKIEIDNNKDNLNNNKNDKNDNKDYYYKDEDGTIHIDNLEGIDSIDISQNVETNTDVKIEWLSNIIDCPITSLSATLKYIIGAIILGTGIVMVVLNVKKHKNNI